MRCRAPRWSNTSTAPAFPLTSYKYGDLVFFKNTYRRGISHVGIYIGDGHFVHACNETKGVIVSALSEAYYQNHYAGARRVIASSRATDDFSR